jgi:hypothetical protein
MEKAQHTPGPWLSDVREFDKVYPIKSESGEELAYFNNGPVNAANSRLMAKAPAMLEVLEKLLLGIEAARGAGCITHTDCWDDAQTLFYEPLEDAMDIIAKAKGAL